MKTLCVALLALGVVAAPAWSAEPDGSHDFDFERGSWHIHLRKLMHPLSGRNDWVEFDGTSVTRPLWGSRANIEEFEADSPTGHIEGLTLRTYNPQTHNWQIFWSNSNDGRMDPPQIGRFKDGVGRFYAMDTVYGKTVLIRYEWSKLNSGRPHFEQAFSEDGGKTWEVNWITDQWHKPKS